MTFEMARAAGVLPVKDIMLGDNFQTAFCRHIRLFFHTVFV